tara:strand:+ start:1676 stop:2206 length:531 start_codon:yes stop_codon:yes gene_type:complete
MRLSTLIMLALAQPVLAQTVLESDFTVRTPDSAGRAVTESTTQVPLIEGACYNWHLRLEKVKGEVAVTEVYSLPAPATTWNLGATSATTLSSDRLTATTKRTLTPDGNWISAGWCVAIGDPPGEHRIEILSGDKVLKTFRFDLRLPRLTCPPEIACAAPGAQAVQPPSMMWIWPVV